MISDTQPLPVRHKTTMLKSSRTGPIIPSALLYVPAVPQCVFESDNLLDLVVTHQAVRGFHYAASTIPGCSQPLCTSSSAESGLLK